MAIESESCDGFFSGERIKKHEIDYRFGGHFRIFYSVGGHLNGHFWVFFKRSPLKNPPLVYILVWEQNIPYLLQVKHKYD